MDVEKTIRNLKLRGYSVKHFATGEEAAAYLDAQIDGTTVGIGGCMTAKELGLYDKLAAHNEVFWHWIVPGQETIEKANAAAVYISSANAMTEGGEILNIDGNGNRLAGQVYGRKRLFIVAGTNKICPDFESALSRARNVAATRNALRFESKKTPCKLDGKCHDCRSADRICNALLVLWAPMGGMTSEIILIDEELGY
jgi:hypothetical protein